MAMEVTTLPPAIGTDENSWTKVKVCGNIISTTNYKNLKRSCDVIKVDKDHYLVKSEMVNFKTGELLLHQYEHTENRFQGYKSLLNTFSKLRDIINCNITDVKNVHWCTLTYAENMQDLKRLKFDFENFWKRFKNYCRNKNYPTPEYINAVEPQERGAWHIHVLIIWSISAPFIPHEEFWKMWSPKGFKRNEDFVKIQSLYVDGKAVDNVGAYLTTYLTDTLSDKEHRRVKYNRLKLYPNGMNVYRTSKNIKRPVIEYMSEKFARKKVSCATLTFEKRIALEDNEKGYSNELIYRYYNSKPRESQELNL